MLLVKIQTEDGETLDMLTLKPKEFKTQSRGFHATGKIEINGKRYQANIMLVEIGSKPGTE